MSTLCTVCNHYSCPGCLGAARDEIKRLNVIIQSLQGTNINLLQERRKWMEAAEIAEREFVELDKRTQSLQLGLRDIGVLIAEVKKDDNDYLIRRIAEIVDKLDPPRDGSVPAVECAAQRIDFARTARHEPGLGTALEIERLNALLDQERSSVLAATSAREALEAELEEVKRVDSEMIHCQIERLNHQIALTDALVEALPKCDKCDQPATRGNGRGAERRCDEHKDLRPAGNFTLADVCPEYPRAAPIRAIQKDRADRAVRATIDHVETSPMVRTDRERGYWQYKCSVCGQIATSSTIYKEQKYDYGTHCGEPWMAMCWVSIDTEEIKTNG